MIGSEDVTSVLFSLASMSPKKETQREELTSGLGKEELNVVKVIHFVLALDGSFCKEASQTWRASSASILPLAKWLDEQDGVGGEWIVTKRREIAKVTGRDRG